MARSAAELAAKLHAAATYVDRSRKEAVFEASLLAKEIMIDHAGRSGLKPGSKLGGRPWSVGFDVKGTNRPTSLVRFRGPVHWVEGGTKSHVIGARLLGTRGSIAYNAGTRTASGSTRGSFGTFMLTTTSRRGTRERKGKRALYWSGATSPKAWAWHPGTRARPFWRGAKTDTAKRVPPEVQRQLRRQLVRAGLGSGDLRTEVKR